MQFAHFDGSLTPVPSIHDALMALDRKDDYRNPVHRQTTGRDKDVLIAKCDEDTGKVTLSETTTVVDYARNDEYLPDVSDDGEFDAKDARDVVTDWNDTPYGFYREDVTRRYHAKLLNAYRKDGRLCVGSVRIFSDDAGVTAACVKCKAQLSLDYATEFYGLGYDAELMQEFTARVIAHGHNHSAAWVSKTPVGAAV